MKQELKALLLKANVYSLSHLAATFGMKNSSFRSLLQAKWRWLQMERILEQFAENPLLVQECFIKFGDKEIQGERIQEVLFWLIDKKMNIETG